MPLKTRVTNNDINTIDAVSGPYDAVTGPNDTIPQTVTNKIVPETADSDINKNIPQADMDFDQEVSVNESATYTVNIEKEEI